MADLINYEAELSPAEQAKAKLLAMREALFAAGYKYNWGLSRSDGLWYLNYTAPDGNEHITREYTEETFHDVYPQFLEHAHAHMLQKQRMARYEAALEEIENIARKADAPTKDSLRVHFGLIIDIVNEARKEAE